MIEFSDGPLVCKDCSALLDIIRYRRKSGLCDECEFTAVAPEGWAKDFLNKLEVWKDNQVS